MKKFLLSIITLFVVAALPVDVPALTQPKKNVSKKPKTSASVRQQQRNNRRVIKETSKKIEVNKREISRRLNSLDAITADISQLDGEILSLNKSIAALDSRIAGVNDSIDMLNDRLSSMSAKYGSAVKKIYSRNRNETSNLAFIFSAGSVAEAYRRSRSLEQFSKWRRRKAEEIENLKTELNQRRVSLEQLKSQRNVRLGELNVSMASLKSKRDESDKLIASLKREGSKLKTILNDRQREAAALEAELQRLIEAEQQKAREEERRRQEEERKAREAEQKRLLAEQKQHQASENKGKTETSTDVDDSKGKQTDSDKVPEKKKPVVTRKPADPSIKSVGGDFASNRGRITFPVEGRYKIVKHFGRSKHPELKYVETDNPGIDIETSSGAGVRAAFDGKVSDIFRLPGYNTIVMIRHGRYLTVYANLGSIMVKKGDTVKNGEIIGTVYADPDDGGRSVLHFEIRNEKAKENPENWLLMR